MHSGVCSITYHCKVRAIVHSNNNLEAKIPIFIVLREQLRPKSTAFTAGTHQIYQCWMRACLLSRASASPFIKAPLISGGRQKRTYMAGVVIPRDQCVSCESFEKRNASSRFTTSISLHGWRVVLHRFSPLVRGVKNTGEIA